MLEWGFLLAVAAIMAGAVSQRVTGMGFVLLAVPFLVLALGPINGVILANWCGIVAAGVNLISVRKNVEWRRIVPMSAAAVVGCIPGALLIRFTQINILALIVAVLTLVALIVSVRSPEGARKDTAGLRLGSGFLSGLMGVTAGVAAPPMVIYRKAVSWEVRRFAASLQFHFMIAGIAAVVSKWGQAPSFSILQWAVIVATLFIGSFIGAKIAPYVSAKLGLKIVMIIAFAGTISTLVRAIWSLVG